MAAAIGSIIGGVSSIAGLWGQHRNDQKMRGELDAALKLDPTYKSSPYAANTLGLAQTLLNSRMAGAAGRARSIYGTQANTIANAQRNATDASQALAVGAASQGQADQSFGNEQQLEGQDYLNKVNNLNTANQGMTAEGDKVFDDSVRRWQDQVNTIMAKYKSKSAGNQSLINAGGSLASTGIAYGNYQNSQNYVNSLNKH